jgi:hypothetical protein
MKINWENILRDKFNYLLMTQIIILVAYPLFQVIEVKFPIIPLLLLIAIAPALWVGLSRKVFLVVISVGVVAFLLNVYAHFGYNDLADEGILVLLILYAVFYFLAIAILITKISSNTIITADTIKGGISIYFLLGFLWAVFYMILLTFDSDALTNTPVTRYAKILALMEAVTGPVYLAIFVAQIIGLNIAQKMKGDNV